MSFDGVFAHAMVRELKDQLVTGRISNIHQPYENEVVCKIYFFINSLVCCWRM